MDEDIGTKISNIVINFLMINVIIYGFVGNFLCFKIFTSTKLNKYPISVYFRAISIFDSLVLLEAINFLLNVNLNFYINKLNDTLCKIDTYFLYATTAISPWLMVIVSFDRFINSAFPKRFLILHKFRTQMVIVFSIVLSNYFIYWFLLWKPSIASSSNQLY